MRRLLPLVLPLLLPLVLLPGTARAQEAPPEPLVTGTIDGSDGRAVDALLGFDWLDADGRRLNRDGCPQSPQCPLPSYGTVLRVNPDLVATGTADTATATTTFSVRPPLGAAKLMLEAYPQDETHRTNEARYGHAMRHSVPLPLEGPLEVHLPLVPCDEGGIVGAVRGTGTLGGAPLPLRRVVAWSLEPFDAFVRPSLGWNIGTASVDGTFTVPNLAGDQRYQVWVTAADGTVRRSFGVFVPRCGETRLDLSFDPPATPTVPVALPPPPPTLPKPVITSGETALVEGAADPGATVELLAASRPDPTLRVVRRTTASPSGYVSFSVLPATTTELRLRTPGGEAGSPALLQVRSGVSVTVARTTAPRTLRLSGGVRPGRAQAVSLYLRVGDGGRRLLATGRSGADGRYALTRRFLVPGTLDLFVTTRGDALTTEGRSPVVRTRLP